MLASARAIPSVPDAIPVRSLLVQHTVSALLATNGVTLLERDLGIAVSAKVVDGLSGVLVAASGGQGETAGGLALREGAGAGGDGWWFVGFARHGGLFWLGMRELFVWIRG